MPKTCQTCQEQKSEDDFYTRYLNCKKCCLTAKKDRVRRIREDVFRAYGGECACCGETELSMLQLDHVNNDGAEHRRQLGCRTAGWTFYARLIKLGYPTEPPLQVLCGSCHFSKTLLGECAHRRNDALET